MKISLFGLGKGAEDALKQIDIHGHRLEFVFDNHKGGSFAGKEIRRPDIKLLKKHVVLISVLSYDIFLEIKEQLEEYGLEEFKDFYHYEAFFKKVVVINANCYGPNIRYRLNSCPDFYEKYFCYPVPEVQNNTNGFIDEKILKNADVFLYQDIKSDNQFSEKLSEEYINGILPKDVKCICIPNLVKLGKIEFPQLSKPNERNKGDNHFRYGLFPFKDNLLEQMIMDGESDEEIIRNIVNFLDN